jgi:hypothetical protein
MQAQRGRVGEALKKRAGRYIGRSGRVGWMERWVGCVGREGGGEVALVGGWRICTPSSSCMRRAVCVAPLPPSSQPSPGADLDGGGGTE